MRLLSFIIIFFLSLETIAQKCDRPEEVYIQLSTSENLLLGNHIIENSESQIFLNDSSEVFERKSELTEISEDDYKKIKFNSIKNLREKEIEIIKCEAKRADQQVYVDTDINSVFKKIFIIFSDGNSILKFRAYWVDGIE